MEQTAAEVEQELNQTRAQLEVVLKQLVADPSNEEFLGVKQELSEVSIAMAI